MVVCLCFAGRVGENKLSTDSVSPGNYKAQKKYPPWRRKCCYQGNHNSFPDSIVIVKHESYLKLLSVNMIGGDWKVYFFQVETVEKSKLHNAQ